MQMRMQMQIMKTSISDTRITICILKMINSFGRCSLLYLYILYIYNICLHVCVCLCIPS